MQKREHVIHYMLQGHVHLSKKDYGFFHNVQKIIHDKKIVTSNQNKLFEKLLHKYSRQLKKLGHEPNNLLNLSWHASLVETSSEYTGVQVWIDGKNICFRSPFNNRFIKVFKSQKDNPYTWDKNKRVYVAECSTYALKILYHILPTYFTNVEYSDELQELTDSLQTYVGHTFNPTLKNINGHLVVVACNQFIADNLKNLVLAKTPKCFYKLSQLGVAIDKELMTDPILDFAGSIEYEFDITNIQNIGMYCSQAGIKSVFISHRVSRHNGIDNQKMKSLFAGENIELLTDIEQWDKESPPVLVQYHSAIYNNMTHRGFSKYIVLKNSRSFNAI